MTAPPRAAEGSSPHTDQGGHSAAASALDSAPLQLGQLIHFNWVTRPSSVLGGDVARISVTDRRELLFGAALRVLARDGLAALTTRAIVAEAQMSLASFHYAYGSHEDLLIDIMNSVIDGERLAGLDGLSANQPATPRAAIHGALSAYLDLVRTDPGREQGMFELTQYALRNPTLAHLATRQYANYHAAVVEMLDYVAAHFSCTWRTPTADVARLVVSLTDGLTLAWLTDRDDAAAERLVDLATDVLLTHLEVS